MNHLPEQETGDSLQLFVFAVEPVMGVVEDMVLKEFVDTFEYDGGFVVNVVVIND